MAKHIRKPLISRVPRGLREQPGWVFIGVLMMLVGLGYVTNYTESTIVNAVGVTGMRIWGTSLFLTGCLLILATIRAKVALEKLALRILSCNMLMYGGWLLSVTSFRRVAMTVVLALLLAVTAELRVIQLRMLMTRADQWVSDEQ